MSLGRFGTTLLALASLTVGTLLLLPASSLRAQTDQASPAYSVTVVNHSGVAIYFKIVGGKGRPFVEATLQPDFQIPLPATSGQKVLCVWNMEGNLMAAWRVGVQGDRTVTIPKLDPSDQPNFRDLGNGWASVAPGSPFSPPPVEKAPR